MSIMEASGMFIEEEPVHGEGVLVKVDLVVPCCNTSLDRVAESIHFLVNHGARTVIIPDGESLIDNVKALEAALSRHAIVLTVHKENPVVDAINNQPEQENQAHLFQNFHQYSEECREAIINCASLLVNDSLTPIAEGEYPTFASCVALVIAHGHVMHCRPLGRALSSTVHRLSAAT
jgi:hypothetical protein